ncbi:MAG: tetratricopeptide repeat protein, partial [Vampirovibrionia bacterium]
AITLGCNEATIYNCLGYAYDAKLLLEEALPCYKKAIEINPGYVSAYVHLAQLYYTLQMYEESVDTCNTVLELYPALEEIYFCKEESEKYLNQKKSTQT